MRPARIVVALFAAIAVASTAACGGDSDPQPDSAESPSPSVSSSEPSPDAVGGPPDGWEDDFTDEQLATYEAALARWDRFSELANEIYREGRDTPEARETFREYSLSAQRDIVTLAEVYDEGGVRREQPPDPLWSVARSVEPTQVVIMQCTDYTDVRVTNNGEVLDNKPENLVTPLVIRMTKPEGRDWIFESSTLRDETSCA